MRKVLKGSVGNYIKDNMTKASHLPRMEKIRKGRKLKMRLETEACILRKYQGHESQGR